MSNTNETWECFLDASYYDMWAVRRKSETAFGQCFHLMSGDEAKELTRLLNLAPSDNAAKI